MANTKKIDIDLQKELELLETELEENQKLFDQVKDHYDQMLKARGQTTLKFITDQTSNIMNIRNNRITIIKEMINVKKITADMQVREININKDIEGEEGASKQIAREVYALMKSDSREGSISNILNNKEVLEEQNNPEISDEDMLEKRMQEINDKKQAKVKKEQKETPQYIIATDLNKKLYGINLEGTEIIEDVPLPDDYIITFETDELTGEMIAFNQYGDELPIIEVA